MFLQPELPSEELLCPEAASKHKHTHPAPSPGALTGSSCRGKRGLLAEKNLTENGAQEPFTVSPNPLPSSSMSLVLHVGTYCPLHHAGRQDVPLKQEVINTENRIKKMCVSSGVGWRVP